MCNNMTIKRCYISKDVVACSDALESLKTIWARNNSRGVLTVWTTDGPRFFNMAQTSPAAALRAIKNDTGAGWEKILIWVKSSSVDDLY